MTTREAFIAAIGQTPLVLSEQTIDSVTQFLAKSGLYVLPEGHVVIEGTEYKVELEIEWLYALVPVE